MRFVLFYHSLVSDWNHGNAHFLRGVVRELLARGHEVAVYEPVDGWSRTNLREQHGDAPERAFAEAFPELSSHMYTLADLDLEAALAGADVVLVHEWNDPALVAQVGLHRRRHRGYVLLFHDTHHRSVTAPHEISNYDLQDYDGVLAFGEVIRQRYIEQGWSRRAFTWHEAADARTFGPRPEVTPSEDLVWVGNWGDDERTAELYEFLLDPVAALGLRATVHGVRYPAEAIEALRARSIVYGGWLPNHEVPRAFARRRVTVHVPRRPYVAALPGIPTIRVFEALACGIPLVSAPWDDAEGLFRPGQDYLIARDGAQMRTALRDVIHDAELAASLRSHGLHTIALRHTCGHRVEELLGFVDTIGAKASPRAGTYLLDEVIA